MKSTQFDKEILELLRKHNYGLALYQIAKKLNKDPGQMHRKLKKLINHRLISKIKSYPCIYKLDFRNRNPTVFLKVKCPKCDTISLADYIQLTKVCPNSECFTNGRKIRTRFQITQKTRVVGSLII